MLDNDKLALTDNEPKCYLRAVKVSMTLRIALSQVIFDLGGIFWHIKTLIPSGNCPFQFWVVVSTESLALYSYPGVGSNTYPVPPGIYDIKH